MNLNPAVAAQIAAMPSETKAKLVDMVEHIDGAAEFLMVSPGAVFFALTKVPQAELSALRTPHQLATLLIGKLQHRLIYPAAVYESIMSKVDAELPDEDKTADFSEFTLLRELAEENQQPEAA